MTLTDESLNMVEANLPKDKYHNIQPFKEEKGNMGDCFTAQWGLKRGPKRKVFVKIDKTPEGPNAEFLRSRDCNTKREVSALLEIDPEEAVAHNINPLLDFYETHQGAILVSSFYENSTSLRRLIDSRKNEKRKGLSKKEFEQTFSQILEAERYLIKEKGLLHRDPNNSNILVREGKIGLEARLTDFGNAAKIGEITPSPMPTAGARTIRDPTLGSNPEKGYGEQNEIYSLCMDALIAATGKVPEKDEIKKALEGMPKDLRKHVNWIRSGLSLDQTKRHVSIEDLVRNFEQSKQPGIFRKTIQRLKKWAIPLTAGLAIATSAAGTFFYQNQKDVESAIKQAKDEYRVKTVFDGDTFEVSNNFIELAIDASTSKEEGGRYPQSSHLKVRRGEEVHVYGKMKELPRNKERFKGNFSLEGSVYIEGYQLQTRDWSEGKISKIKKDKIDFYNGVMGPNTAESWGYAEGGYHMGINRDLSIPENLKDGTYILAVEVYAPSEESQSRDASLNNIKFERAGHVIARKRIPLVVGNPQECVDLGHIYLSEFDSNWGLRSFDKEGNFVRYEPKDISYVISIPEEDFSRRESMKDRRWGMGLPNSKIIGDKTLIVTSFDTDGNRISYTGLPTRREISFTTPTDHKDFYRWTLVAPDRNFYKNLIEYRSNLDSKAATQPTTRHSSE